MADIVERLRAHAAIHARETAPYSEERRQWGEDLVWAADEIVRLREIVRQSDGESLVALIVERDRLRTACDEANDLLESARPAENLEGASDDEWYDAVGAWRRRNEYDKADAGDTR